MKIHTDILTPTQILSAVPSGCYLAVFDHPGFGRTRIGDAGSRSHDRAYVLRLSGSTKSAMRNLPDKAATWDEWGIFIAEIFRLDPNASVGQYKTHDDFIAYTTDMYNRTSVYRPDLGIRAPWLSHN